MPFEFETPAPPTFGSNTDTPTNEQNTQHPDDETYFSEFAERTEPFDAAQPQTNTFFTEVVPDAKEIARKNSETAKFLVSFGDKGAAFLFKLIAGDGDTDDFELDAESRREIADIVRQMLPTNAPKGIPLWLQLVIAITIAYAPKVSTALEIRKERKLLEAERQRLEAERHEAEIRERIRREETQKQDTQTENNQ